MRTLLGLIELGVQVWGIIAFWGTAWSITMLVFLSLSILLAVYVAGKQQANEAVAKEIVNNLFKEVEKEKPEEESKFTSFFKKEQEDE